MQLSCKKKMPKIKSLRDIPTIHQYKQTTIKKGLITHRTVIKDTAGNEYKKTNGKLERMHISPKLNLMPLMIHLPTIQSNQMEYLWFALIIFLSFVFLIIINWILEKKNLQLKEQ